MALRNIGVLLRAAAERATVEAPIAQRAPDRENRPAGLAHRQAGCACDGPGSGAGDRPSGSRPARLPRARGFGSIGVGIRKDAAPGAAPV